MLRDGLPEGIRSLCLAVLGRTTDQLVQLQLAARELSDRAATLDKDGRGRHRVERLTRRLEDAERELARRWRGLRAIAENEAATYPIDGVNLSPAEVGAWLRRAGRGARRHPGRGAPAPPPLTADEFGASARAGRAARAGGPGRGAAAAAGDRGSAGRGRRHARHRARRDAAAVETVDALAAAGVDIAAVRAARPRRRSRSC